MSSFNIDFGSLAARRPVQQGQCMKNQCKSAERHDDDRNRIFIISCFSRTTSQGKQGQGRWLSINPISSSWFLIPFDDRQPNFMKAHVRGNGRPLFDMLPSSVGKNCRLYVGAINHSMAELTFASTY